ncbi:MAG: flagellar assembly peptidoglycan hydrolase FlgJ [Pseudomonadota bacterium]
MNLSSTELPQFYYDLQSLAPLHQAASENPDDIETLREVAQQFESMFMQMVLKSMRSASFGDGLFDSKQSLFYRDMLDQQLSLQMSDNGGMGLADLLVEQLSRNSLTGRPDTFDLARDNGHFGGAVDAPPAPVDSTGTPAIVGNMPPPATVSAHAAELRNVVVERIPFEPADLVVSAASHKASQSISNDLPVSDGLWDSPAEYVRDIWPYAVSAAKELGVDPRVLVAQSALETGWGLKVPKRPDGSSSFNLFGIKAGRNWTGDKVMVNTLEYVDKTFVKERSAFRAYDSIEHAMDDYVSFLKGQARYADALENAADPEKYSRELQRAGYATDPIYADKILRVMRSAPMRQGLAGVDAGASTKSG